MAASDIPAEVRERIDPPTMPPPAGAAPDDGEPMLEMGGDAADDADVIVLDESTEIHVSENAADTSSDEQKPEPLVLDEEADNDKTSIAVRPITEGAVVPRPDKKGPPPLKRRER